MRRALGRVDEEHKEYVVSAFRRTVSPPTRSAKVEAGHYVLEGRDADASSVSRSSHRGLSSSLERQQTCLDVEAAGKSGECARGPDDTMARGHDRNGISAVRRADRSHGSGVSNLPRDLCVGSRLSEGNCQQSVPHLALKGG